jgi:hypothetical protein
MLFSGDFPAGFPVLLREPDSAIKPFSRWPMTLIWDRHQHSLGKGNLQWLPSHLSQHQPSRPLRRRKQWQHRKSRNHRLTQPSNNQLLQLLSKQPPHRIQSRFRPRRLCRAQLSRSLRRCYCLARKANPSRRSLRHWVCHLKPFKAISGKVRLLRSLASDISFSRSCLCRKKLSSSETPVRRNNRIGLRSLGSTYVSLRRFNWTGLP